ncbi:putative transglycosylase [Brevibacillus phage SecTim467]|uniref:Putative transglycosylase n=2 Tax=Jenstvirus jenst TaxID=1982225 RepID=A0A0K2CNS6_9CAUD|nr:transglycosylase [Brevibacillus phage Jenst]ALA07206.1 putative transglycosylase [Brevibacillus phage Jenst]ALA07426.1 putative transglycosylase [Brevibacillus phage SecTim467]
MKKLMTTVAIAMTITACSPQEEVKPQATATKSVLKVGPLVSRGNEKESPKAIQEAVVQPKPAPVKQIPAIEQNIANHLVKHKVAKGTAKEWASFILKYSEAYGVDPYTILAMIQVETGRTFNPNLVGRANDVGLLQVRPKTQEYMGIKGDRKNPRVSIEIGCKYLAYNQKRFGKDLGIVAYNQGEGNVSRGTYNTRYLTLVKKALATIDR